MGWWHRVEDTRKPDFIIGLPGKPYLLRWWLIPRNPILNVYLHKFLRSDDDRALHDHPWVNLSYLLEGDYLEVTPKGRFIRTQGACVARLPRSLHRVELAMGRPVWTLFITGPRVRVWGFACPQGWIPHHEFTAPGSPGQIGKGCDQ